MATAVGFQSYAMTASHSPLGGRSGRQADFVLCGLVAEMGLETAAAWRVVDRLVMVKGQE